VKRIQFTLPIVLLTGMVWHWVASASAQDVVVTPDKADGIYQIGEPVHWRIEWKGKGTASEANYAIKQGGQKQIASGAIPLTDGVGTLDSKLDEPGSLLAEIRIKADEGKTADDKSADEKSGTDKDKDEKPVASKEYKASGGALIAPDQIKPAKPRPDDFDSFWDDKLKELAAVPANPQLEKEESNKKNVDCWKITLDNIRSTHIQGRLARPSEGEKFPALLIPQWAGVYPLQKSWATDRAAEGWLVLNINAHDLPIDKPEEFYKEQSNGPLKNYPAIGNDDRDTSYFLRMYLSCVQAAEYLRSRPDWDGKTLVVSGTSQGGQQTLMLAGLDPKITAALALVPAGSDELGPEVNRAPGWPMWYWQTQGKDADKVREASRYYDINNFAPRIKCPVLIGLGEIDHTCPPAGIYATFDLIPAAKEVVVLPNSDHQEVRGSQRPFYQRLGAWMSALKKDEPPPVKSVSAATMSATSPATGTLNRLPPTHDSYLKLAAETEAALQHDVLEPWFPRCVDHENGGFYCDFDRQWQKKSSEGKFSVFQGRMTWITAEVALRRPDLAAQFLPYTQHGLKFLNDVMWDRDGGGTFWGLDDDGNGSPNFGLSKQLYGIGFCLYAAANSYRATKDPAALDLAQRIFRWVEEHAHDEANQGYFEWLAPDGTPRPPEPGVKQPLLVSGLPVGGKSMNTHIHYLEALAQLYRVWPDETVRKRLSEMLAVVRDKICQEPGVMNLYFTFDWKPTWDRDSYGHDIETAYLLLDSAEALGATDDPKTQHMARLLVDHVLATGWDETHGGIYQEGPMGGKPDALAKDWWPQFETLNSLLVMHEKYGSQTDKYFQAFLRQWEFIRDHQIDHEYPGVIESVQADGTPITKDKGRMWKAAYHDGRALLNVTDRLKKLAGEPGEK
jgi:mannose/cellobiose epimerase-like protein (N-acyl-D-glucosamine 2-epimerase family)/cephalosporin-C deacetylase-like acetyl esterase